MSLLSCELIVKMVHFLDWHSSVLLSFNIVE
jgi:hypothetical protein